MQTELFDHNSDISKNIRNENYIQTVNDKEYLSHMQNIVYEVISCSGVGICDKAIQKVIHEQFEFFLPISSINARRNELVDMGMVMSVGFIEYPDHNDVLRKNTLWGIKK